MRRPKSHFTRFQKAFRYWQKEFGLVEYCVTFRFEPLDDCYASVSRDNLGKTATVWFSSELSSRIESPKLPEDTALHEVVHLLLGDLRYAGECRYVRPDDLEEAEERIVRTLEHVITELQNSAKKCSPRKG